MYVCARLKGTIAQLVEQRTENPCVPGSNPGGTTTKAAQLQPFFVDICWTMNGEELNSHDWQEALQLSKPDRVAWIHEKCLDQELLGHYRTKLLTSCTDLCGELGLEGGEPIKTWLQVENLLQIFKDWGLTRSSVVVTTGGGALSDAVGFAASIWKRGVRLIHIPTTPLSAVDAAWGGKTGINWGGAKNQLGTFAEPLAVHIDAQWMRTLSPRHFRAGLAEVAKHAFLNLEAFDDLCAHTLSWPPQNKEEFDLWSTLFVKSSNVKRQIVADDPEERGVRCILNLGHTLGHAVEAYTSGTSEPWLHGEAVALGLHFALFEISHGVWTMGNCQELSHEQAKKLSVILHTQVPLPQNWSFTAEELWNYMAHDKKNVGNEIRDVAWRGVGHILWPVHWKKKSFEATWSAFVRSWEKFSQRATSP